MHTQTTFPDIRVADFDRTLGHLVISPTRRLPIRRADLGTFQLGQELTERPDDLGLQLACLKRIVPDITDEELRSLTPDVVTAVVNRALTGITEVQTLLGESSGASPESGLTDSPPETLTPTSAAASPPTTG